MIDRRLAVLAIGGPTATGKTGLAIEIARQFDGEIINADSRQVYREMDIGTAKPTAHQRAMVPHHLLDLVLPSEEFTLAHYVGLAGAAIEEIHARGKLPLLVGGTGLYLRAVLQGYSVPAVPPNPALRQQLEQDAAANGSQSLIARLRALDPAAAGRIDPRNLRRVIRALEVSLTLGVPFSSLQRREAPYRSLLLVLHGEPSLLYARADARLETMLHDGFEAEVRGMLEKGYATELPAFSALGYRELADVQRGLRSRAEAMEAIRSGTHAFIRRQRTWFRGETAAQPLEIGNDTAVGTAITQVQRWLASAELPAGAVGAPE